MVINVRVWAILLLLTLASWAGEYEILTATSDQDTKVDRLLLVLDERQRATHLIHRRQNSDDRRYTEAQLRNGVALKEQAGKKVIELSTVKFKPERGGKILVRYLVNGLPPASYASKTLKVERKGKTGWGVFDGRDSRPIKTIHFLVNKLAVFGVEQVVGIRKIRLIR